jgi:tripartite-type tricarboxylate transporter receptor subunit TctC
MKVIRSIAAAVLAAAACAVQAQSWPAKPIHLISPYPPGGTNDVTGRIVGDKLAARLGQPVLVENKPGANTRIAAEYVAKSAPDGYTLFWVAAPHTVNPALYGKLPYDTVTAFAPVAQTVMLPVLLTVPAASPAKTLKEFLELAKKDPKFTTVSSPGNGSGPHLAIELLIASSGAPLAHVPYKGDAPALNDLLGGQLAAGMAAFGTPLPHVKSGKLRALAVVSRQRMPQLPDVPTFAEAGYPQVDAFAWFGMLAPAGTPEPVIARLNTEVNAVLSLPDVRARFEQLGALPIGGTPAEFDRFIRADIEKWTRVVKERGIKPD